MFDGFDADDALKGYGVDGIECKLNVKIIIYIYKQYEVGDFVRIQNCRARNYSIFTRRNA